MKCAALVLATKKTEDGKFLIKAQMNGKLPAVGEHIECRWGKRRTGKMNSIYWVYLTWLIDEAGMRDAGYMTKEELHEVLKSRFLAKKTFDKNGIEYTKIGSTTELTTDEFLAYMEKVEHCIQEYCGISSSPFWRDYADFYGK